MCNQPIETTIFHKKLISMIIGTNIAFHHINKQYFIELFTFLGVDPKEIPSQYELRNKRISYSNELYREGYNNLQNNLASLIVDGTTSWSTIFYEFSIFVPGKIRYIKLMRVLNSDANSLKKQITDLILDLRSKAISIVGICTDNGPNLKNARELLHQDFLEGKNDIPLIRFSCAAHTAQLLV